MVAFNSRRVTFGVPGDHRDRMVAEVVRAHPRLAHSAGNALSTALGRSVSHSAGSGSWW